MELLYCRHRSGAVNRERQWFLPKQLKFSSFRTKIMGIDPSKWFKYDCFRPKVMDIDLPKQHKFGCFQPKVININLPKQLKFS